MKFDSWRIVLLYYSLGNGQSRCDPTFFATLRAIETTRLGKKTSPLTNHHSCHDDRNTRLRIKTRKQKSFGPTSGTLEQEIEREDIKKFRRVSLPSCAPCAGLHDGVRWSKCAQLLPIARRRTRFAIPRDRHVPLRNLKQRFYPLASMLKRVNVYKCMYIRRSRIRNRKRGLN